MPLPLLSLLLFSKHCSPRSVSMFTPGRPQQQAEVWQGHNRATEKAVVPAQMRLIGIRTQESFDSSIGVVAVVLYAVIATKFLR